MSEYSSRSSEISEQLSLSAAGSKNASAVDPDVESKELKEPMLIPAKVKKLPATGFYSGLWNETPYIQVVPYVENIDIPLNDIQYPEPSSTVKFSGSLFPAHLTDSNMFKAQNSTMRVGNISAAQSNRLGI